MGLKLQSQSGINEAALRLDLLQIPGVQDLVFVPYAGGFTVYLYGISPVVAPSLLQLANDQLAQRAAYPIVGAAISPDLVGITLTTSISFTNGTVQAEKDIVTLAAESAAANYINNLKIGQTLIINDLADVIRNADARISDVGDPNRPITEIFISGKFKKWAGR